MPDLRIAQSSGDSTNLDGFGGGVGASSLTAADINNTIAAYLVSHGYNPGSGGSNTYYSTSQGSGALSTSPPTTQAIGDIPYAGASQVGSRDDHVHGMPAFGSVYPQLLPGLPPTDGTAQQIARADHSHGTPTGFSFGSVVAEQTFGGSSANGASSTAARSDHQHGNPSDVTLVHLAGTETITGPKTFNAPAGTLFTTNITAPNVVYTVTANTGVASTGGQNPVLTNTGVLSNAGGTGISIANATGNSTITNTGVIANTGGLGISVSTPSGSNTITNTGVLSNLGGTGISITNATGNSTITNTGIISLTAGPGISITAGQNPTISNTGVLSLAVVNNATLSGSTGALTLTNSLTPTFTTVTINGVGTALSVLNAASIGTTLNVTGAATLSNTLSVSGQSTLAGLSAQATTTTTLTASGNTAVTGTSTFTVGTGATSLGGTLGVTGASTLAALNAQGTTVTTLTANGVVTLNANTSVTGANTFTVGTGATALGGTLNVTSTSTLNVLSAQATTVTTLHSTSTAAFDGNTSVTGAATFTVGTGSTSLGGALVVTGATALNSTLNVTGLSTLAGLNAQATQVTTLNASGVANFAANTFVNGTSTFQVGVGATSLGGTLLVSGAATLNNTLHVLGPTTLDGNTNVTGSATFTVGTGATGLGGTLTVSGAVTNNSTTTLNGNTSVTGTNTLTVGTGSTTLGGVLTVAGAVTNNSTTTLNGNTSVTGASTLTVGTGATALGGQLTVQGITTLNAATSVTGSSTFSVGTGASTLGGTLVVGGATTLNTTLHTIGATSLDFTLSVGNDATFLGSGNLTQPGRSFTVGDIVVTRTFTGNVIKSTNIIDGQVQANDMTTFPGYIEDGSFEDRTPGTTTWTMTATNSTVGSWAITSDPGTNLNGYNGTFYATHTGSTGVGATGTDIILNNAKFAVVGGSIYFAQCMGKSSTGTNGTTSLTIFFYDATGAQVNASVSTPGVLVNGVNTYTLMYATATAPPAAVYGRIAGTVTGKTIGQVYLDGFMGGPGLVIPNLSIDASTKLIDNTLSSKTFASNAIGDPKSTARIFTTGAVSASSLTTPNTTNLCEDPGFEQFPSTVSTTWDVINTDNSQRTPDTQYQILLDPPRAHLGQAYLLHNPTFPTNIGGNGVIAQAHNNLKANCSYGDKFFGSVYIAPATSPPTGATGANPTSLPADGQPGFGFNYRDNQGQPYFVWVPGQLPAAYTVGTFQQVKTTSTAPLSAVSVHFTTGIMNHTQGFWLWDDCVMNQQLPLNQFFAPNSIDGSLITTGQFNIPSSLTIFQNDVQVGGSLKVGGNRVLTTADSATNTVTIDTAQTITGQKTFSPLTIFNGAVQLNNTTASTGITNTGTLSTTGNLTAPNVVYSVTASGNMASSGGQNPNVTITATPTFTSATIPTLTGAVNTTGNLSENGIRVYSATTPNLATTVTSQTAYNISPVVGTGVAYARNDHTHGTPATPVTSIVAGSNVTISGSTGAVTINATGNVTSVAGRTGAVTLTAADIASGTFPGSYISSSATDGAWQFNGGAADGTTFLYANIGGTQTLRLHRNGNFNGTGINIGATALSAATASITSTGAISGTSAAVTGTLTVGTSGTSASGTIQIGDGSITKVYGGAVTINGALSVPSGASFGGTTSHTGTATFAGAATFASNVKVQSGSNAYIQLQPGTGTNSGYIEFFPATGARQGYIGYSSSSAGQDSGTIPYVAGTHGFSGAATFSSTLSVTGTITSNNTITGANLSTAGNLTITGGGTHQIIGNITETGQTISQSSTAAQVPQTMRGVTGQTANLTNWTDPTGATVYASVSSSGALTVPSITSPNVIYSLTAGAGISITGGQNATITSTATSTGIPATTVSSGQSFAAAPVVGTLTTYAREDHNHGTPATPVTSIVAGTGITISGATGAVTITNSGSVAATTVASETAFGLASAVGTGTAYARNDHVHGTPPTPVTTLAGTAGQIGVSASTGAVTLTNLGVLTVAGRTGAVTLAPADVPGVYYASNANLASTVASETAFAQAAAAGTGVAYARNDHTHGTPATPATSVAGRTGAVVLSAPDIAAGAFPAGSFSFPGALTASSGLTVTGAITASTTITENGNRVYSAANPNLASTVASETAFALAAVVGTGVNYARQDHVHGTPATPVTSLTAGTNVTLTGGPTGAITVNATGAVSSVAGRTGAVVLTAADIGGGTFPNPVTFAGSISTQADYIGRAAYFQSTTAPTFFNASVNIVPLATNNSGLVIRALSGQTADLLSIQNSGGGGYFSVNSGGVLTASPANTTGVAAQVLNGQLLVDVAAGGSNNLGTTAGAVQDLAYFRGRDSNTDNLLIRQRRVNAGTSWTTSAIEILRKTDATDQATIRLGGVNGQTVYFPVGDIDVGGTIRQNGAPIGQGVAVLATANLTSGYGMVSGVTTNFFQSPASTRVSVSLTVSITAADIISFVVTSSVTGDYFVVTAGIGQAHVYGIGGLNVGAAGYSTYVSCNAFVGPYTQGGTNVAATNTVEFNNLSVVVEG